MRSPLFIPSIVLAFVLCFLPTYDASEAEPSRDILQQCVLSSSSLGMSEGDEFLSRLGAPEEPLLTGGLKQSDYSAQCSLRDKVLSEG